MKWCNNIKYIKYKLVKSNNFDKSSWFMEFFLKWPPDIQDGYQQNANHIFGKVMTIFTGPKYPMNIGHSVYYLWVYRRNGLNWLNIMCTRGVWSLVVWSVCVK